MDAKLTVAELVETFLQRGGHVDKYYLREANKSKHAILFLHGWYAGNNIREALMKALA